MIRRYLHLLSTSVAVPCCDILYRQHRAQTCGCVTLFVVIRMTENGGMTIWQHGSICIEKIDKVEVEEEWSLCPGKVIFEHPTELTNNAIPGSPV